MAHPKAYMWHSFFCKVLSQCTQEDLALSSESSRQVHVAGQAVTNAPGDGLCILVEYMYMDYSLVTVLGLCSVPSS